MPPLLQSILEIASWKSDETTNHNDDQSVHLQDCRLALQVFKACPFPCKARSNPRAPSLAFRPCNPCWTLFRDRKKERGLDRSGSWPRLKQSRRSRCQRVWGLWRRRGRPQRAGWILTAPGEAVKWLVGRVLLLNCVLDQPDSGAVLWIDGDPF
jgi:hypothetical protein